jgi:pSer/pThr/pTyr-binding forkhead associated (FHA) protein
MMKTRLVSLDGQVRARDTSLDRLPVVVGSAPDAGLRLEEQTVSPLHCRIDRIDGRVVVRDLGSVHGTFVNGSRISTASLASGDTLSVGLLTFFFQSATEDHSATQPGARQTRRTDSGRSSEPELTCVAR